MSGHEWAKCDYCDQQMSPGTSCLPHRFGATRNGVGAVDAQPYDGEWTGDICHDCNAPKGGFHHAGCDVERCPKCGLQAIGCDHTTWVFVLEQVRP